MPFTSPIAPRPKALPPAALDHYWHPERDGVEQAPEDFRRSLAEVSDKLAVVRPPAGAPLTKPRAWLVWYKKPAVKHPLCPGWSLMFDWRYKDQPLPLDNRVIANVWMMSVRAKGADGRELGSSIKYFEKIVSDLAKQKAAKEKHHRDDRRDRQGAMQDFYKIKNIGRGNKFALHHDSVHASKGEQLWRKQTARSRMPSEVLEDYAKLAQQRADYLRKS
jgi:hypothetical protein